MYLGDVIITSCTCTHAPSHSDIIVGMGTVKPSQYVKQLLGSVKSMYEMRMPPEFVSYL